MLAMSETRGSVLAESKKKGLVAGATTVAAVTVGAAISTTAGVVLAVPAAFLGWRWWQHRAKNGIRF